MTYPGTPRQDTLHAAVSITESICRLPAVATLDWLDRAAAAMRPLVAPSRICLLIVQAGPSGRGVELEAAGFAGIAGARSHDGAGESGIELQIRSRAERLEELGFAPPDDAVLGTVSQLVEASDWRTRGIGTLWQGVPGSEVLVAAELLGRAERGRVLVTMVGPAEPGAEIKPGQLELLGAIHPLLVRRAVMAIGPTRATSSRWLTSREQEVLDLLVVGKSVRVIAEELQRSPHTVHDHVKSLHRKLGASSRGELVAKALGHTPLSQPETAAAHEDETVAEVRTTTTAQRLHPQTMARPYEPSHVNSVQG